EGELADASAGPSAGAHGDGEGTADLDGDADADAATSAFQKRAIRNKILAIGRLSRVFQVLREESERVTEFKSATGERLPQGTLMLGAEGVKAAITNFEDARKVDLENERLPPSQAEVTRKSEESRREALERAAKEADNDARLAILVLTVVSTLQIEAEQELVVSVGVGVGVGVGRGSRLRRKQRLVVWLRLRVGIGVGSGSGVGSRPVGQGAAQLTSLIVDVLPWEWSEIPTSPQHSICWFTSASASSVTHLPHPCSHPRFAAAAAAAAAAASNQQRCSVRASDPRSFLLPIVDTAPRRVVLSFLSISALSLPPKRMRSASASAPCYLLTACLCSS
ncbi:3',5'-cyclic-nucleotide phosphodiesterase (PDEase) (3':5'-CNP), partial [Ascosphaera acerosa]